MDTETLSQPYMEGYLRKYKVREDLLTPDFSLKKGGTIAGLLHWLCDNQLYLVEKRFFN